MKKTNFTFVRPLMWMFVPLLLLLAGNNASAQCALACNDNVQVSVAPDWRIGNTFDPCLVNLNLDMILEGTSDVGGALPCGAAFGRIEVRRGNTLITTLGPLTTQDQLGSFDGTIYLGQSLTTKVTLYDQAGNALNSCWGSITIEDKARPVFECEVSYLSNLIVGELDGSEERYRRTIVVTNPAMCALSNVGTNVLYDTHNFTITTAGVYTFDMVANSFDAHGALYSGGFDPTQPCNNILAADDDSGSSLFGPKIVISLTLVPGEYTLVTTSFSNNTTGSYKWNIGGPMGVAIPGSSLNSINKSGGVLVTSNIVTIDCTQDPNDVPAPTAYDNCDRSLLVNLINETITTTSCGRTTIRRTYIATDDAGNDSDPCTIEIRIEQPELKFPDDITWTCEQYAAYPNIINPSELHQFIMCNAVAMDQANLCCIPGLHGDDVTGVDPYDMALVQPKYWEDGEDLDVTLDPNYDDNIDNPVTDPNPNVLIDAVTGRPIWTTLGNVSSEVDNRADVNNTSVGLCPAYDTIVRIDTLAGPIYHIIDTIIIPRYRLPLGPGNVPVSGLEDADVLALTGSGVPNVDGTSCNFAVTYSDKRLEACDGIDPNNGPVFKILRTWTVLNWCTGQVYSDIQIIKVVDKKKPTIQFFTDERFIIHGALHFSDTIASDKFTPGPHPVCASSGLLDVPHIVDNCTGISNIRVFTPVGQATPVYSGSNLLGFRIPAPYLPIGRHAITYEATDGCGNITTASVFVNVVDGIPPVPICREVTQVALTTTADGLSFVNAKYFDEGSYDNCGPVYFKVLKMTANTCNSANINKANEIAANQEWFDDEVIFCCSDIQFDAQGNQIPVQVILRVYDTDPGVGAIRTTRQPGTPNDLLHNSFLDQYRYNDCMILVYVEDKARPTCTPPENIWTTCAQIPGNVDLNDTTQLQALFGDAAAYDNCDVYVEELRPSVSVDHCGVGQVIRTWRARDRAGNTSAGICRQTVMIMQVTNYEIDIPGDFEDECTDARPDTLVWREIGCDLLAVNKEDKEFPASAGGECKKIERTYKIINWCEYDGFSDPVIIPRLDRNRDGKVGDGFTPSNPRSIYRANYRLISNGDYVYLDIVNDPQTRFLPSTGYYTYTQFIKIFDDTAPELRDTLSGPYCGGDRNENPCTGLVNYLPWIDEECTPDNLTITWQLDRDNDGTFESNGTGRFNGRVPLGSHRLRFRVADDCGNTSQIDVPFDVIDCKAPTPVCFNGLSIDLMPTGMVELWAIDLDASSFDYCHPIKFRVNRITDLNGDGFITSDDYRTTPPPFDSVVFRCKDLGITYVQLWVGEESTDNVNNWDFCVTFVDVQDNLGGCSGTRPAAITGGVKNEGGTNVPNVNVQLSGTSTSTLTTNTSGAFAFNNLVTGNDYTVTPQRDDDVRNGVTTFDLALISKHILGVQLLNSPYKIIAADANNSRKVTTLDLVVLRKVILFVEDQLPNNTSWRFVDKNFIFPEPENPFKTVFPEVKNFNDIVGTQEADFIAIKVGDVNGNANPAKVNGIDPRSFHGTLFFDVNDKAVKAGEEVKVTFNAELAEIEGYQFTLNFNSKVLELVNILDGAATTENFGLTMLDKGVITASWNGEVNETEAFTLVFKAKADGQLSDLMDVSSEYTIAEAYNADASLKNVAIRFNNGVVASADFALYQNTPNPFKGLTTIRFNLPEAATATLTISDVAGKVVKVIKGDYAKGYNEIVVNGNELSSNGVLSYKLETSTHTASKKMIIIE